MPAKRVLLSGLLLLTALPLAAAEEDEAPPLELLEFLGDFETADGKWIDPTELEVPPPEEAAADRGGQKQ